MYVPDYPISTTLVADDALYVQVTAKFNDTMNAKVSPALRVGASLKTTNRLDLRPHDDLKVGATIKTNTDLKSKVTHNTGINVEWMASGELYMQPHTDLKINTTLILSMIAPYRFSDPERQGLTWSDVNGDPELETLRKFLWKEY